MIVLMTDFGLGDPYVGQMKGVLLSHAPDCRIVDLTHGISPYGLEQAGFFLNASYGYFPEGTIFMAVVDPGVGGSRRILCLEAHSMLFLAPDNGLLCSVVQQCADARLFDLTRSCLAGGSSTFHGRDIFSSLAAHLYLGDSPESLGAEVPLESMVRLPVSAARETAGAVQGHVLHVDHFGNVISNLAIQSWDARLRGTLELRVGSNTFPVHRAQSYYDIPKGAVGLVAGSQGYFELSMNMGRAADHVSLAPGDALFLTVSA